MKRKPTNAEILDKRIREMHRDMIDYWLRPKTPKEIEARRKALEEYDRNPPPSDFTFAAVTVVGWARPK
jgi:hypothetical protein